MGDCERGRLRLHDDIIIKLAAVLEVSTNMILGVQPTSVISDDSVRLRTIRRVKRIERLSEFKQKLS